MDKEKFEGMLDDYYQLHGWDNNGNPSQKTIDRLQLGSVMSGTSHHEKNNVA